MTALIQANLPTLLVALLIGVATGAWIARARGRRSDHNPPAEDKTP